MIRGRPLVTAPGPEIEDGLRNFEERPSPRRVV